MKPVRRRGVMVFVFRCDVHITTLLPGLLLLLLLLGMDERAHASKQRMIEARSERDSTALWNAIW